jgi:hypothetical protein
MTKKYKLERKALELPLSRRTLEWATNSAVRAFNSLVSSITSTVDRSPEMTDRLNDRIREAFEDCVDCSAVQKYGQVHSSNKAIAAYLKSYADVEYRQGNDELAFNLDTLALMLANNSTKSNKLYKDFARTVFRDLGFCDMSSLEDAVTNRRIFDKSPAIVYAGEFCYDWKCSPSIGKYPEELESDVETLWDETVTGYEATQESQPN